MTHEIVSLFPTLLSIVPYGEAERFNAAAKARIEELARSGGTAKPGQWQSHHRLNEDSAFAVFTSFMLGAAQDRFAALRYKEPKVAITGLWANVNEPGFAHPVHAHSNNFLSGVYYVSAPEGCGGIVFMDPRKQQQVLVPTLAEITPMTAMASRIEAKDGRMILFPSWLEHYTEENRAAAPRISLSFNLMLTGNFGSPETFAGGYVPG